MFSIFSGARCRFVGKVAEEAYIVARFRIFSFDSVSTVCCWCVDSVL